MAVKKSHIHSGIYALRAAHPNAAHAIDSDTPSPAFGLERAERTAAATFPHQFRARAPKPNAPHCTHL